MSTTNNQSFYQISLVFNIVAIVLMLLSDYGGLYYYSYYFGIEIWVYINLFTSFESFILIGSGMALFGVNAYIVQKAIREKRDLQTDELQLVYKVSLGQIGLVILGFVVFLLNLEDASDWWLDGGFYASLIGSIVNFYIFNTLKNQAG